MPIEPWWETNPATTPRQELGMVSPELPRAGVWCPRNSARRTNPARTPRQDLGICVPELPSSCGVKPK